MNNFVNPYDVYGPTPDGKGKWDIQLFLARYQKKNITLMELMQIFQELFEKFPYAKDYTINTISFGSLHSSTCIEVDNERRVIIVK